MTQLLRRESPTRNSHISSRTIKSRLWFVNNKPLELKVVGYLARLVHKHEVTLYAFSLMGNHFHEVARFPLSNRAPFMRDFKSQCQRYVKCMVPLFGEGPLWSRRYDEQILPLDIDIEDKFFYTVLQPIAAGLCDNLKDSPYYNCFHDAISGVEREFEYFRASEYEAAKKKNPRAKKKDFVIKYKLKYARLPGYEKLTRREYRELMLKKFAAKRLEVLRERKQRGISQCLTKEHQKKICPGAEPRSTKKTERHGHRPIALSASAEAKRACIVDHFAVAEAHHDASKRYRAGEYSAEFPPGTYRPPLLTPPAP